MDYFAYLCKSKRKKSMMMAEYLVTGRTNGTTRMGSPYGTLKVKNLEDEKTIAVWDMAPEEGPKVGQLVTFRNLQENDGKVSARKFDVLPGTMPDESHPLYHLLPRPVGHEAWQQTVDNLLKICAESPLRNLIADTAEKLYTPYSQYPAATSIHHAYRGGLLNHTWQMLHMLEGLAPCLPYPVRVDHCVVAILFHDYGKVYTYSRDGEQQPVNYLMGHIYLSANKLHRVLEQNGIDASETESIVHIVLAHHGLLEYGSPVMPCSQEAIIVHMLDNLSAKTDTIEHSGNMEYVSALGTHVVKQ